MADVIRTKTELLALAAIGVASGISAQDLRDMLVSILGCYGGIKIVAGSTGQATVAATPEVMTEWTDDGISNGTTPAEASNQITIDNAGDYEVHFDCSFQGVTNSVFQFELYKDGSPTGMASERKAGNTDVGNCGFEDNITLAAAEVLTIWVEGSINGTFTATEAHFKVKRIG